MNRIFIPVFLIMMLHIYPAEAQDIQLPDTSVLLPEVVVSYQAGRLTPVSYQNLDLELLKSKSIGQEPSFILSETPSITVYSDAGNTQSYSYFRMRGIDQTRINITLDGVPLNEPEDQGAYFSNYPDIFNSLDKVQIQRGVGTTKNGVAGFAGSIQMFSPDLTDPAQTTFGLGYGSYNSMRAFAETQTGLVRNKALYVRISEVYSDGYKYHSGNHSQSAFVSGAWYAGRSTWKMNLIAGHQQNDMAWLGVSDSLINADRRNNANAADEKDEFWQSMVQLHHNFRISNRAFLQSAVYYTFLKGNYDFDIQNFLGLPSSDEMYNYDLKSNLWGAYSNYVYNNNKLKWISGIHANTYNRQHMGWEKSSGVEDYRNTGYKNEASLFTQVNYRFNRFSLFADLQYRYATFDYKGRVDIDRMDWSFFNPKAGVSYQLNSGMEVYYSIGRIGREPTRTDMFGGNEDLAENNEGRPDIVIDSPEYVTDNELGFKYRGNRLKANANLYYMDFDHEIVLNGNFGPNGLALTSNVERSFRTGIEVSASWQPLDFLALANNSSYNYSRIKEHDETFCPVLTPGLIINQDISWLFGNVMILLSGRYQDRSYIDFANEFTINRYFLLNMQLGYTLKKLELNVYINNITNTKYYNHAYIDDAPKYFVQAPVNFYLSVKYKL